MPSPSSACRSLHARTGPGRGTGQVHRARFGAGVHHAAEFDEGTITGALDHTTVMHRDDLVDQVAPKASDAGESEFPSVPVSREKPTTSAVRIAVSLRSICSDTMSAPEGLWPRTNKLPSHLGEDHCGCMT